VEDQLLGAAIMKVGSIGVTLLIMAIAFYRWSRKAEK
jgi:putative membrane protein